MPNRAYILKHKLQNCAALPFEQVLNEAMSEQVLQQQQVSYRQTLYTPVVTLWAWLFQVLDPDKSLSNTVTRVVAWLSAAGAPAPSLDTGAYCKARQRLPWRVLQVLLTQTGQALHAQVNAQQRWCGRRVKAYDGTSVTMSDTSANQAAYPQHSSQKAGCGFPIVKLVVWFCVNTGAVLEVAIANFTTSEWQMSRQLYKRLTHEDVVVADSAYGTYMDLSLVQAAHADAVFRAPSCPALRLSARQEVRDWRPSGSLAPS